MQTQALPSAKGYIPAHETSEVTITWKRPRNISWDDLISPTISVEIYSSDDKNRRCLSSICFIATVDLNETCFIDDPPFQEIKIGLRPKNIEDCGEIVDKNNDSIPKDHSKTNSNQPRNIVIALGVIVASWFIYKSFNTRLLATRN